MTTCRTGCAFLLWAAVAVASPGATLDRAEELYRRTEYRQALQLLEAGPERTAAAYELIGRCFYMLEDFKKASDALEKATAADPRNARAWDWLGKAFGKRAETSSFLTAPSYASKARQYFVRAVELDPHNLDAIDDLFEYYLEAPGLLGGGVDKAANLSEKVREQDPAKYHSMKARLAEKQKQLPQAEQFWRQAAQLAPSQVGRLVDLAKFFARQGRFSESEETFQRAAKIAPDNIQLKFEHAKAYIRAGRNREAARKLLEEYLKAPLTPDDPPRAEAERLLRSIARRGLGGAD